MNLPEPRPLWDFFYDITRIPRPSGKEERIMAYLEDFAAKRSLSTKKDEAGNLIIIKPGTPGFENAPVLILQAHTDMVCEKNTDTEHDFLNDPIQLYFQDDWAKAKGTTLGADNGIGMAMMLAVLDANNLKHPPLECLFTVDEETGLTGAAALQPGFLTGKRLINLDSEDDGIIFIGCAGGIGTKIQFDIQKDNTSDIPGKLFGFEVSVSGLKGGHSGDDINRGYANAIQLLGGYLSVLQENMPVYLTSFQGGNLHNAIPREAVAHLAVPYKEKETVRVLLNCYIADVEEAFKSTDPKIRFHMESETPQDACLSKNIAESFIQFIQHCPNGMIAMSEDMPGLVETSTNLASVKLKDNQTIEIVTSQRSADNQAKKEVADQIKNLAESLGAKAVQSDGYPGWKPNLDSAILKVTAESYRSLFQEDAELKAIHAGLECGLFLEKYPELDMVSIGPQMKGVHSPDERLSISSTMKNWLWLTDLLAKLNL